MSTIVRKSANYYPTLFDSVFGKDTLDHFLAPDRSSNRPAVNIAESAEGYKVELAVPGLKKEDFKINVEKERLIISAEKKSESADAPVKYSRREFSYHSFQRVFNLPESADTARISAGYEAGVLEILIPKKETESTPPTRQIEIA